MKDQPFTRDRQVCRVEDVPEWLLKAAQHSVAPKPVMQFDLEVTLQDVCRAKNAVLNERCPLRR